jgi:hypothetical protein
VLGAVLAQRSKGNIDHPIYFYSPKLSNSKKNYKMNDLYGLVVVYALHKFRHCLLGTPFKFFTHHSTLKYLVKNLVLGGRICHWLFLFKEFKFEVVFKPKKYNVRPNHLSRIKSREVGRSLDDELPDVQHFLIEVIPNQLVEIVEFVGYVLYSLQDWSHVLYVGMRERGGLGSPL